MRTWPRQAPDRHAFSEPAYGPARNVYVAVDGALALLNHLAVRDVLRRNAELRRRFGRFKLDLASQDIADMDAYVAATTPVLQDVLRSSAGSRQTTAAEGAA